jgi:hypothetical protein
LTTTCLQKNLFFAGEEDIAIDQISRLNGTWVLILPHLGWSRVYLMLGIHHTLVWNRVLQNMVEVVVASTVVGPVEGQAALEDVVRSWILSSI